MPSRCILILLDGLGDRSYACLGGLTPLQAANTPNLDMLASQGATGLFHADRPGVALPSENAHFSLFGYPPEEFPGRGALEALGARIDISNKGVAILAHLVSVAEENGELILVKDRPPADLSEISALVETISSYKLGEIELRYEKTRGLDGLLILSGKVSPCVTDSDPMREGHPLQAVKPWRSNANDPAAQATAKALREYLIWCYRELGKHPINRVRQSKAELPVNAVAVQRPGCLKSVETMRRRWGLRGLSISSGLVYWGLARYIGMDICEVRESGNARMDLRERLRLAKDNLNRYDLIHVHTKAPDTAAHSKKPELKKAVIEALDQAIGEELGPVLKDPEVLVVLTSDHSTPSSGPLIHSGEPVPFVMIGDGMRRDQVMRFDEVSCSSGVLGLVRGNEFMYLLLNHLDRAKLRGIMDTPDDQPFWPGDCEHFRIE